MNNLIGALNNKIPIEERLKSSYTNGVENEWKPFKGQVLDLWRVGYEHRIKHG